jgi:hypothetical protein
MACVVPSALPWRLLLSLSSVLGCLAWEVYREGSSYEQHVTVYCVLV